MVWVPCHDVFFLCVVSARAVPRQSPATTSPAINKARGFCIVGVSFLSAFLSVHIGLSSMAMRCGRRLRRPLHGVGRGTGGRAMEEPHRAEEHAEEQEAFRPHGPPPVLRD